jgi:hypothetical protein
LLITAGDGGPNAEPRQIAAEGTIFTDYYAEAGLYGRAQLRYR